jgi:hypothetical protein
MMLALVGTVMMRSASGKVLLRDGDGVLGTHRRDTVLGTHTSDPLQLIELKRLTVGRQCVTVHQHSAPFTEATID